MSCQRGLEASTITDIQQIDGVREASLLGTTGKRVTITPDADALSENGLTSQSIRDALDANGVLLAAGQITEDGTTLTVQAGQRLTSPDDIAALPLLGGNGQPTIDLETGTVTAPPVLTIDDVADVALADNPVTGISRVNGEPALTIAVTKTPAGNTVDVSKAVQAALPDLQSAIGDGTKFTVVFDQAPFIEQSIESLATEGLLGLGFAVIVIFVFLLSIRSTIVTAISIPVSVLLTFIGMLATGYTLTSSPWRAHHRHRPRRRRLDRRHREHQETPGPRPDQTGCHQDRCQRGRHGGHRLHHHDSRRLPPAGPRRRHHR